MNTKKVRLFNIAVAIIIYTSEHSYANTLTTKITVMEPPMNSCIVNDEIVNFGKNIDPGRIDGNNYTQIIPIGVQCDGNNNFLIRMHGRPSDMGANVLKTSQENIGIALTFEPNGTTWPLNSDILISGSLYSAFKVGLVKRPGTTVTVGPFFAESTITIMYY